MGKAARRKKERKAAGNREKGVVEKTRVVRDQKRKAGER